MKKKVCLLLAAIMALTSLVVVPVSASAPTATVTVSSAVVLPEAENVEITVTVSDVTSFPKSMKLTPVYDDTKFELVSGTWDIDKDMGNELPHATYDYAMMAKGTEFDPNTQVFTLVFNVLTSDLGEIDVSVIPDIMYSTTHYDCTTVGGKITVVERAITSYDIQIDTNLNIGVHVVAQDAEGLALVALNEASDEYAYVTEYEEGDGDYIFKLPVAPYAMGTTFMLDFADAFTWAVADDYDSGIIMADEEGVDKLPRTTAKTVGILQYCEDSIADASDELKALMADMLVYGQKAAVYNGSNVLTVPAALTDYVSAGEWLVDFGDGDVECSFGEYCSVNFPADWTGKNTTAKGKFKFASADVEIGSAFKVTITAVKAGSTAISNACFKVDGEKVVPETDGDTAYVTYEFTPMQYAGITFDLYASKTSLTSTNYCWTGNYGPATYAAFAFKNEASGDLMNVLEAFYLYGVSVENYQASIAE